MKPDLFIDQDGNLNSQLIPTLHYKQSHLSHAKQKIFVSGAFLKDNHLLFNYMGLLLSDLYPLESHSNTIF